jgi:A/G-specific adenine glycosylase
LLRATDVRRAVTRWSSTLDRPLPWRGERDPWRILVSEVMLQQTQAGRVAEIYPRFLDRFPTAEAMARSEVADVLRAWCNLGYNRRALNLWRAAQLIAAEGWPRDVEGLAALPGLGPYTARAVASFAFDADVAAVDANVKRVVLRLFGGEDVQGRADELVPRGKSASWNQAMIDFGAVVCTARNPRCDSCPLRALCRWRLTPVAPAPRRPAQRFEDTTRYARGRVVAVLRECGTLTAATIAKRTALEPGRLEDAIASLERDGLIYRRGRTISLGRAASSRR